MGSKKWPPPLPPLVLRSPMNCPTDKSSPLVMRDPVALKPSSNPHSWEWSLAAFTRPSTTPSGRTFTPTLFFPVAPPCTLVLPIVCKRKSPPWLLPPSKSRSLPHQRGNIPYGSVVPSWRPCLPSNRCGSPNKNTTNPAPELFTGNASKKLFFVLYVTTAKEQSYLTKKSFQIMWLFISSKIKYSSIIVG